MAGCTYRVMLRSPENLPVTCDLCGGDPACVRACYPGALQFREVGEAEQEPFRAVVISLRHQSV